MVSKSEFNRSFLFIAIAYGLWNIATEWSKLLAPYIQWELKPEMDIFKIGVVNTVANFFLFIGTICVGHILDAFGTRFAGVVVCVITCCYYLAISQVETYYMFLVAQSLHCMHLFPQVTEAFVGSLVGENNERERARALMMLGVPMGVGLVVGPWLAAHASNYIESDRTLQAIAGAFLICVLLPVVLFGLPDPRGPRPARATPLPSVNTYMTFLQQPAIRWSLALKFFVDLPYLAYDQLSRPYLVQHFAQNPSQMSHLFILIGMSTVLTNLVLIKPLQNMFRPRTLVEISLTMLCISYGLLGVILNQETVSVIPLMVVMPIQVIGVSIAYAEIAAQVIGAAAKKDIGKASGLNQCVSLMAGTLSPLIGAALVSQTAFVVLCTCCAGLSLLGALVCRLKGSFMNIDEETRLLSTYQNINQL